jgi:hypothetical protein
MLCNEGFSREAVGLVEELFVQISETGEQVWWMMSWEVEVQEVRFSRKRKQGVAHGRAKSRCYRGVPSDWCITSCGPLDFESLTWTHFLILLHAEVSTSLHVC